MDNSIPEIIFNAKSKVPVTPELAERQKKSMKTNGKFSFERRRRVLTETEKAELRKAYSTVIVNDYGDEYHMSDEERKRRSKYYEAFAKIRKCKRKFHKLDDYVKVYRLCLDCLQVVAESNGVYDPMKFMKLVLRGEIEVFGLNFPKYIGKDRKTINWEYVSEFITDRSKDPSELSSSFQSELSKMDDEDVGNQIIDEEECDRILDSVGEGPDEIQLDPTDEYIEKYGITSEFSKKEMKQMAKMCPQFLRTLKDMAKEQRRKERNQGRLNSFVYELRNEDFDYIAGIDRKRGYQSSSDIPKFTGDISNRSDYKRYLKALKDYEDNCIKENYRGRMRTKSEIEEIKLKDALESDGWNVRNLYKSKDEEKKLKKAYKRDKQREKELKKRLLDIQERQKHRKNKDIEFNAKAKSKKKKKKKKEDD